ncbi:MAG: HK97 gp10 family phage protein [Gammaproteobacteria bacterium]|nr:HK97 gp10 family phage protein [Gammaproteobacteria bacterium]
MARPHDLGFRMDVDSRTALSAIRGKKADIDDIVKVMRQGAPKLLAAVKSASPVDSGALRAGWRVRLQNTRRGLELQLTNDTLARNDFRYPFAQDRARRGRYHALVHEGYARDAAEPVIDAIEDDIYRLAGR